MSEKFFKNRKYNLFWKMYCSVMFSSNADVHYSTYTKWPSSNIKEIHTKIVDLLDIELFLIFFKGNISKL